MLVDVELCLVGTAQAENLGGVARLCDNFGVAALTLVAPRVAFVDHALAALDAIDYGRAEERARTRVHLRRLVAETALGGDALASLHGICAQVIRKAAR